MHSASLAPLKTISQHPTIGKGVRAVRVLLDYYDYNLATDIRLFAEFSASFIRFRGVQYFQRFAQYTLLLHKLKLHSNFDI